MDGDPVRDTTEHFRHLAFSCPCENPQLLIHQSRTRKEQCPSPVRGGSLFAVPEHNAVGRGSIMKRCLRRISSKTKPSTPRIPISNAGIKALTQPLPVSLHQLQAIPLIASCQTVILISSNFTTPHLLRAWHSYVKDDCDFKSQVHQLTYRWSL